MVWFAPDPRQTGGQQGPLWSHSTVGTGAGKANCGGTGNQPRVAEWRTLKVHAFWAVLLGRNQAGQPRRPTSSSQRPVRARAALRHGDSLRPGAGPAGLWRRGTRHSGPLREDQKVCCERTAAQGLLKSKPVLASKHAPPDPFKRDALESETNMHWPGRTFVC